MRFYTMMNDLGIDLGTANTLVHVSGKGIMVSEPSYIAQDRRTGKVLATGTDAKVMAGRTPARLEVVRPLQGGVISNPVMTRKMLQALLAKIGRVNMPVARPRVVLGVPGNITEVEKRAVREAGLKAGAAQVYLLEEPLAGAIGARLPVNEPTASMIVDIGAGRTEVAVISLGAIVINRSIQIGGNALDEAVVQFMKDRFRLVVGERRAENAKINIGSAYPLEHELRCNLRGLDLVTKLPKTVEVSSVELREVFNKPLQQIIGVVKEILNETPPELFTDIMEFGLTLIGGGAFLAGLDRRLSQETGLEVHLADDPMLCVVRGTGIVAESLKFERYRKVIAASQEERRYKLAKLP